MEIVVNNDKEYIEKVVELMSMAVGAENQLSPPDKRFLIECVNLSWQGIDIGSRKAVVALNEQFGWNPKSRHVYKHRAVLKSKGWVSTTAYGLYTLPPSLTQRLPDEIKVEVKFKNNKKDNVRDNT